MKLTIQKLKQLIKEELNYLREDDDYDEYMSLEDDRYDMRMVFDSREFKDSPQGVIDIILKQAFESDEFGVPNIMVQTHAHATHVATLMSDDKGILVAIGRSLEGSKGSYGNFKYGPYPLPLKTTSHSSISEYEVELDEDIRDDLSQSYCKEPFDFALHVYKL